MTTTPRPRPSSASSICAAGISLDFSAMSCVRAPARWRWQTRPAPALPHGRASCRGPANLSVRRCRAGFCHPARCCPAPDADQRRPPAHPTTAKTQPRQPPTQLPVQGSGICRVGDPVCDQPPPFASHVWQGELIPVATIADSDVIRGVAEV